MNNLLNNPIDYPLNKFQVANLSIDTMAQIIHNNGNGLNSKVVCFDKYISNLNHNSNCLYISGNELIMEEQDL